MCNAILFFFFSLKPQLRILSRPGLPPLIYFNPYQLLYKNITINFCTYQNQKQSRERDFWRMVLTDTQLNFCLNLTRSSKKQVQLNSYRCSEIYTIKQFISLDIKSSAISQSLSISNFFAYCYQKTPLKRWISLVNLTSTAIVCVNTCF